EGCPSPSNLVQKRSDRYAKHRKVPYERSNCKRWKSLIALALRSNNFHQTGLACPLSLDLPPALLRHRAQELFKDLFAIGSPRGEILQGFEKANADQVSPGLVSFHEELLQ